MSGIDKVEWLKKNGPATQYGKGVRLNKNGSLVVSDAMKIKAKGSPNGSNKKRK